MSSLSHDHFNGFSKAHLPDDLLHLLGDKGKACLEGPRGGIYGPNLEVIYLPIPTFYCPQFIDKPQLRMSLVVHTGVWGNGFSELINRCVLGLSVWAFSIFYPFSSVQFSHSVMSDSLWPHESQHARPPVHHQLPEFTQTHVHQVGDAIQPSHPLSFPSPSAPNPSQHQGLFQWVNSSHEVAKVLEFQLQH